ncbi:MAG: ABC transporter substrate-binding protein [Casimicrobiaceae bacterium]
MSVAPASLTPQNAEAFRKGMRELGYVEGSNLVIEWRYADGKFERLPDLAAELVRLKVDVIVAVASGAIGAAQKATSTIPIVMTTTGDPVGSGFVKSLAKPGGNITGLSNMGGDTGAKQVDLMAAVVPNLSRLGLLVSPTSPTYLAILNQVGDGARSAGLTTVVAEASTPQEIDEAFALMTRERVDAMVVGASPFFGVHRQQILALAIQHRTPAIFGNRTYADAGGLISYGQNISDGYLRAASYVDKILRGAKPGDMPIEQPLVLELVVNLKTARAIGLTIPKEILLRADAIIE